MMQCCFQKKAIKKTHVLASGFNHMHHDNSAQYSTPTACVVITYIMIMIAHYQTIPGNDQNASPTNQKTTGSKLDRTS